MKNEDALPKKTTVSSETEIINTDEQITDYAFAFKLTKQNNILDFDCETYGFCLE